MIGSPVTPTAAQVAQTASNHQKMTFADPDERQALYERYRGAFAQSLALASGTIAVNLSSAQP